MSDAFIMIHPNFTLVGTQETITRSDWSRTVPFALPNGASESLVFEVADLPSEH